MLKSEVSNTVEMNMKTVDTDNDTNITDDGGEGHTSSQGFEILRTLIPDPAPLRSIEAFLEGRWALCQTADSLSSPICDPLWLLLCCDTSAGAAPACLSPSRLSRSSAEPIMVVWSRSMGGVEARAGCCAPGSVLTSSLSCQMNCRGAAVARRHSRTWPPQPG